MIQAKPTIIELDMDKLEEILRRLDAKELDADDYETIKAVIGAYVCLFNAVGDKDTTIRRLRQMLFGAKTEKTSAVIGGLKDGAESAPASPAATASRPTTPPWSCCANSHPTSVPVSPSGSQPSSKTISTRCCQRKSYVQGVRINLYIPDRCLRMDSPFISMR